MQNFQIFVQAIAIDPLPSKTGFKLHKQDGSKDSKSITCYCVSRNVQA
jgi:hypothetical protein